MLKSIDISTSGLVAQRHRLDTIAGNVANANTTRDADGNSVPFQRRLVSFRPAAAPGETVGGVGVDFSINLDTGSEPRLVHEPGHPDANAEGYVSYPNVNLVTEFVNAIEASRAYEANIAAIEITKQLSQLSLRIIA